MDGAQEDGIFAGLEDLPGGFDYPWSPAERERSSRAQSERACMKWKFSVYSLMARRYIENLRDVQAIVCTTSLQNPTATTDGGLSVQQRGPPPLHVPSPPVDVGSPSEALAASTAEVGDRRMEDAYVCNQRNHDLQTKIETLLKMERESEQWTAATSGLMQAMKKHIEKSPIVDDFQKQRANLGRTKDSVQKMSQKLEKDIEKNSNGLRALLNQMTYFARQTYGNPVFSDGFPGRPLTTFEFMSGIIGEFEKLLKRLCDDAFKITDKITRACKELGRRELSALSLFQGYANSISSLVQTLLGKQESNFVSLTTIKKWYCDVEQAHAFTRVLVPPDSVPGEQMAGPNTPVPRAPSNYASPC